VRGGTVATVHQKIEKRFSKRQKKLQLTTSDRMIEKTGRGPVGRGKTSSCHKRVTGGPGDKSEPKRSPGGNSTGTRGKKAVLRGGIRGKKQSSANSSPFFQRKEHVLFLAVGGISGGKPSGGKAPVRENTTIEKTDEVKGLQLSPSSGSERQRGEGGPYFNEKKKKALGWGLGGGGRRGWKHLV